MWIVDFHADGGQTCVPGRRVFEDKSSAREFFKREDDRHPNEHYCTNATRIYESKDARLKDEGYRYPYVCSGQYERDYIRTHKKNRPKTFIEYVWSLLGPKRFRR